MQTTSAAFLAEVRQSHRAIIRAEVWSNGALVGRVYPIDGSVTVDARRSVRRSCDLTLVDEDGTLNPRSPASYLTPYGNELRLWRGVEYTDGTQELVPLGVFRITQVSPTRGADGVQIAVVGEDRARAIQDRHWSSVYWISAGTNYAQVLADIMASRLGGVPTSITSTTFTSPTTGAKALGSGTDGSPWDDIASVAEAIGQEAYFSATGVFTTSPIPSLTTATPVVTYADGQDGVTLSIADTVGSDGVLNGVIARGEGVHLLGPLESRAWDDDPASPTRRTGPLGERPYEWSSSLIVSQAQLDDVAASLLDTVRGQTVNLSIVPNPALDVRDVIRVTSDATLLDSTAVIDTLSIPLTVDGEMQITARMRGY